MEFSVTLDKCRTKKQKLYVFGVNPAHISKEAAFALLLHMVRYSSPLG